MGDVAHKYLYAGGKLLRETYGSNTLDFLYDAGGSPFALRYNQTYYYYITNLQGDVMQIVNASGNVVAAYEYDPYGNIISATGTLAEINPLRYRGYYYDTETRLYYLQARYYDPAIGRFLNADAFVSTGQNILGHNMFAYCLNNPICLSDALGTIPTEAVDVDGDGENNYYRYEYTYSHVIIMDGIDIELIYTGNVYYFPDIKSTNDLNPSVYPKGFDRKSDLMVGNYVKVNDDGSLNPVIYAYQAQHLHIQAYDGAIACMLQIDEDFNLGLDRSRGSMMTEWLSHMVLGGKIGVKRTANIDFDHDAEGLVFMDYCGMVCREIMKYVIP